MKYQGKAKKALEDLKNSVAAEEGRIGMLQTQAIQKRNELIEALKGHEAEVLADLIIAFNPAAVSIYIAELCATDFEADCKLKTGPDGIEVQGTCTDKACYERCQCQNTWMCARDGVWTEK